jgi:hypothetical protein
MLLAVTFGESVALLVLTAALTGVLAPFLAQIINRRRLIEQRRFDEELKRETAFFDAQTQFLKELATAVYDYLEKALAVSYAAHLSPKDFKRVWDAYNAESFALLGRIAAQVSMARTLFSSATADRLQAFYSDTLEDAIDKQLSRMARNRWTTRAKWEGWHASRVPAHRYGPSWGRRQRGRAHVRAAAATSRVSQPFRSHKELVLASEGDRFVRTLSLPDPPTPSSW